MQLIYMHHAERKIGENHSDPVLRQLEDITDTGIEEAKIIAKEIRSRKQLTAIVTSPYLRCKHTASIINELQNVPIFEDERLNEKQSGESKEDFLKRNIECIKELDNKYGKDDIVLCVTSGINLTAFICYFYNIEPTNMTGYCQGGCISPVNFSSKNSMLD